MAFDIELRNPESSFNINFGVNAWVLVNGEWKKITEAKVLVNGEWKTENQTSILVNGEWKDV